MATNEYLPVYKPGTAITFTAGSDVTGGRLVEVSDDNTVRHARSGSTSVVGVAAWDTDAGEEVTTHSGGVQELVASGSVSAGDQVAAASGGEVATASAGGDDSPADAVIGVALTSASADGLVRVKARI